MLDPDGGMYLLLILVLQKSEVTPPVERPLDDTSQEVLRLLLRVGGLQAHSIEPSHTDGALVAVSERLEGDERVIFVTFFSIECINILNVCILCFGNKSLFEGSSNIWRFFAPISLSPVESASWQKSRAHHPHFFSFSGLDDFLSSPKNRLPFLFIVPLCSLSAFPTKFLQNEEEEREKVK